MPEEYAAVNTIQSYSGSPGPDSAFPGQSEEGQGWANRTLAQRQINGIPLTVWSFHSTLQVFGRSFHSTLQVFGQSSHSTLQVFGQSFHSTLQVFGRLHCEPKTENCLGEASCSRSWKTNTYLHSIQLPKHILPTEKATGFLLLMTSLPFPPGSFLSHSPIYCV